MRTIFARPNHASTLVQLHKVADAVHLRAPQTAALREGAGEDILEHKHFPEEQRRQLHTTNPLESTEHYSTALVRAPRSRNVGRSSPVFR